MYYFCGVATANVNNFIERGDDMKLSGWIFMILSWTFIISLATFSFSRIFKKGLGGENEKGSHEKTKNRKGE